MMEMLNPTYFVFLSLFIFCAGIVIVIIKRSAIFVLIGIELMLNAANLNLVYFSQFDPGMNGLMTSVFVVVLAAAEVSIALAILLNIFKHYKITDPDELTSLKN
ncbi:MAG: NADH-quinone oxidoreductase subunit NuoK [Cyclobacteriaceae bacterium]